MKKMVFAFVLVSGAMFADMKSDINKVIKEAPGNYKKVEGVVQFLKYKLENKLYSAEKRLAKLKTKNYIDEKTLSKIASLEKKIKQYSELKEKLETLILSEG